MANEYASNFLNSEALFRELCCNLPTRYFTVGLKRLKVFVTFLLCHPVLNFAFSRQSAPRSSLALLFFTGTGGTKLLRVGFFWFLKGQGSDTGSWGGGLCLYL